MCVLTALSPSSGGTGRAVVVKTPCLLGRGEGGKYSSWRLIGQCGTAGIPGVWEDDVQCLAVLAGDRHQTAWCVCVSTR